MRDSAGGASGSSLLALWRQDLRDRWQGRRARANARWGFLRPPPGSGRVIWIKAGATEESLLIGAEVTRSVRHKRLDVRLALTFEEDWPALIEPRLEGLKKVGRGFGPAERSIPVRRTLEAFSPLGVILTGISPGRYLRHSLHDQHIHTVIIAAPPVEGEFEAVYPTGREQAAAWREAGNASYVAPPVDFLTLLIEAQVDPNFRTVVTGGNELQLWWLEGLTGEHAHTFAAHWERSSLCASSLLFMTTRNEKEQERVLEFFGTRAIRISSWQRTPLDGGAVVLVDDPRWLPAIAASVAATHLAGTSRLRFWQALAGGCPVTMTEPMVLSYLSQDSTEARLDLLPDFDEVLQAWERYAREPIAARRYGDTLRRLFWKERREAGTVADEFLQRVYDW